jgi:Fur family ferric uptake transcriptional regulator
MEQDMSHYRMNYPDRIRKRGFRVTPQRQLILDAICEGEGHTTFDEIYARVQAKAPAINRATVYRALDFFRELGLIFAAEIGGHTGYEIASKPHHHLVCRCCGKVEDLTDYHFHDLSAHLLEEHGFKAELDHLAIPGLCSKCLKAIES